MIEFINSWVQGITIAVIISTIIEMILPNGNIKKYVRTVIGVYIVFIIVSPIITKITGKEIKLESFEMPKIEKQASITIDTNAYIENMYINKIKEDIIENIETKGYKVSNITIEIDKTEENYGNIHAINLQILKTEEKQSNIEIVEINIHNQIKHNEIIEESEIDELKNYLQKTYGTENIIIN